MELEPAISLFLGSTTDERGNMKKKDCHGRGLALGQKDIEDIISNIFSTKIPEVKLPKKKFPEKMVLERITRHYLPDKILLQIEVSMPPDILIQDAIKIAEEAEREILQAACGTFQVCILLRLGHSKQKLHNVSRDCNAEGHKNPLP